MLGGAPCTLCSVTHRSSPTTAPFLPSHSYDPCLAFHPYRTALRDTIDGSLFFISIRIRHLPFAGQTTMASRMNPRVITFWSRDTPRMILHNPCVFYFRQMDPIGAGWRLLELHTSFDGVKRPGSGNPTNIPPSLLVLLSSA